MSSMRLPSPLLAALALPLLLSNFICPATSQLTISDDQTCGPKSDGRIFRCPPNQPCCSNHRYCGSTVDYCLTTTGCNPEWSLPGSCVYPTDGTSTSPDGTCGRTGAGAYGYRCPQDSLSCCSQYGFCGNTSAHCYPSQGCQKTYGVCYREGDSLPPGQGPPKATRLF